LLAITAAYFGGFIFLLAKTQPCALTEPMRSNWFQQFWMSFLSCRTANELGDALAGSFAPVAFLWLAGAVFIQSKELAAQREELATTQDVFRQQLEVSKQQVDETRASTALLKKQTEILEREQKQREEFAKDEEMEQRLQNFRILLEGLGGLTIKYSGHIVGGAVDDENEDYLIETLDNEIMFIIPETSSEMFSLPTERLIREINKRLEPIVMPPTTTKCTFRMNADNMRKAQKIEEYIHETAKSSSGISEKYFLKMDFLGLSYLGYLLRELKAKANRA
jgi:hypothetical protein